MKSSTYWDKRAIKRLTQNEKTSEKYIKRIQKVYNRASKNIQGELESIYRNYSNETGIDVQTLKTLLSKKATKKVFDELKKQGLGDYVRDNYKSRISRLEQIQAQIYAKAKEVYPEEELEQTMCYYGVINEDYYRAIYDVQKGTGYDFSFNKIDDNMMNSVLSEKWSSKNYSQRIWKNTNILADSVAEIVGGALLSGQGIEKTAKQIRERFGVGKYYATRLVRTETNYFHNLADSMAYEEMGIDKYVYVAVLDNRTSEICQEQDGKVYKYSEKEIGVNFPPLHPNCRSTTRGYLGEDAEKDLQRRARNPITGKNEVIGNIGYKDWYNQNVGTYGTEKVEIAYKKVKNASVDRKQFEDYKKYVEKDIKNIDVFKDIKYNNPEKWKNVKSYVSLSRKGEMPSTLNLNKYDDNMQNKNWEVVDFSPKRVDAHVDKHLSEFGDITKEEYIDNARKLLNTKISEDILGFTNENGFVFRYDKNKNEFATSKPSGIIETYYKPKKGMEYWEEQVKKYGNKKDV